MVATLERLGKLDNTLIIYINGDNGTSAEGGPMVFLGRVDHQVKIRGLRVELGEIEVAIDAEASVRPRGSP